MDRAPRTFVLGDIHGAHRALVQVLERSGFDREKDTLIFLGDVADGFPDTRQCIDELLTVKNLIQLIGNHDNWLFHWITTGKKLDEWVLQGGQATIDSYGGSPDNVPASHFEYLIEARPWYQDGNRIFVHGGWQYKIREHPKTESPLVLTWDRLLWYNANAKHPGPITTFNEVFLGHTQTLSLLPEKASEVWNLDTGAGWNGVLTMMEITDGLELICYYQSDVVADLYSETMHAQRVRRIAVPR